MPKCLLGTCCCCINLKIGSIIIGCMDLVLTLWLMWVLSYLPEWISDVGKSINGTTGSFITLPSYSRTVVAMVPENLGIGVTFVSYILNSVKLMSVIALLFGLFVDKHVPVAAYLIYSVVYLCSFLALFFVCVAIIYKVAYFIEFMCLFIGWAIALVCLILFSVPYNYFWWVILSQYYKIKTIDDQSLHSSHSSRTGPTAGRRPHRTTSGTTDPELSESNSYPQS